MSKTINFPTCGGKCATKTDGDREEIIYTALQDEDAFNKIQQLKQKIQNLREQLKNKNAT